MSGVVFRERNRTVCVADVLKERALQHENPQTVSCSPPVRWELDFL